ncbi:hypothetical protein [Streptomyces hebeiensis]
MQLPSHGTLISWQQELEAKLTRLASDTRFTARISEPLVHEAAVAYLTRPSKRLLGMAFLHAAHMLGCDEYRFHDLIAVSAALPLRMAQELPAQYGQGKCLRDGDDHE